MPGYEDGKSLRRSNFRLVRYITIFLYQIYHEVSKAYKYVKVRIGSIKKSIQLNTKEFKSLIHNRDEITNNFENNFEMLMDNEPTNIENKILLKCLKFL